MRYALVLVLAVLALGGCSRCERDTPKPMANPCAKVKPASAAFIVQDATGDLNDTLFDSRYDTDTLRAPAMNAIAQDPTVSYEWIIGAQTFTAREVYQRNLPQGETIEIELRVRKNPTSCLKESELYDTLKRKIYIQRKGEPTLMEGRFCGILDRNINDTVTLTIIPYLVTPNDFGPMLYNFKRNLIIYSQEQNGNFLYRHCTFFPSYSTIFRDSTLGPNHYARVWGRGYIDRAGTVVFNYTLHTLHRDFVRRVTYSEKMTHHSFIGRKL